MDLRRAACETARSIVIMATGDTHSAADAATLRVVIALKTFPELLGHVVVEVLDKEMEYLMKIVGGSQIETLITYVTLHKALFVLLMSMAVQRDRVLYGIGPSFAFFFYLQLLYSCCLLFR
jgi:hypothetical protein